MSDERETDFAPGTTFGRYAVVRRIAVGGMGAVFEARHLDLQKRFALKVMLPRFACDPGLRERFLLEARMASRLSHPHVIAVSDVGVEHDLPYLVMDFLEGEDLCATVEREGPLDTERLADIMLPVISAVSAAHAEGILHRDFKPENIFLVSGRYHHEHPVLLDFGISKPFDADAVTGRRSLTRPREAIGTPDYMSPEQLRALPLDPRSDEYAIGVVLYQCATGVHPYANEQLALALVAILAGGAPPPSSHRPDLPPELDALVLRAMAADREERFPSVHDLGRALWPFASARGRVLWAEEFGDPMHLAPTPSLRPPAPDAAGWAHPSPAPESEPAGAPPSGHLGATRSPIRGAHTTVPVGALRSFGVFEGCPDSVLANLLGQASTRRLPPGSVIVTQGAQGNGCFLLAHGEVEIIKSTAHGHFVLGRLGPGSVFGQIALIDYLPRTATVVAATEVVVIHIGRQAFDALLANTSEAALSLREQIAISGIRQLRRATKRFAALCDARRASEVGIEARRELVYVQTAAQEWGLPLEANEPR
ncbi:MAG: cyclic nucleotide-binding domain-containing protein [Polyangiaceae bacterium]|nr:cyclic nucleotide-binding domain-containing protein [Polyangiaceae bacterium]